MQQLEPLHSHWFYESSQGLCFALRACQGDVASYLRQASSEAVTHSCAGLRDALIAAHGAWSKTAAAAMEPHVAAAAGEEGLGGEGFTMVDGIDEDGSAGAAPAAAADIEGDACAHMATTLLSEARSS